LQLLNYKITKLQAIVELIYEENISSILYKNPIYIGRL